MAREVIVYSKDNCQQCTATKRWLNSKDIEHEVEDATSEDNITFVKSLGYTQAPVTLVKEDGEIVNHWYGFDVNELNKLLAA